VTNIKAGAEQAGSAGAHGRRQRLGPLLCWGVVFADIGTSVYYTPGILYHQLGVHAALFVGMTTVVFILLTFKYAEVTIRYPQGGGVVTVGTQALNPFAGLVGGMFILVYYFLTAALSALSGVIYLSVVFPSLGPVLMVVTVAALLILGLLNWIGISESAKVSALFAIRRAAASTGGPSAMVRPLLT
jgi:amino acid transporter